MPSLLEPKSAEPRTVSTMRAAVLTSPGTIEVAHVPLPVPGQNKVRIRLAGCGVCSSNLPAWEGRPWFQYPMEPGALGHEGYGVVDEVGPDVDQFAVGDPVAMISYHAYAEYDVADAASVVALPSQMAGRILPAEPLGCAMNIFARSGISRGDTVAIIGAGFLGALLVQLAANAGARVIAISRREYARVVAQAMGAAEVIPMDDHWKIIEAVKQVTSDRLCDVVIEAVGKQWPLDLAAELTRERGRLVVAGYHQDGARQVNMQLWNWRGIDVINAHERDPQIYKAGMEAAVAAVAAGRLRPDSLYTHTFTLEDLGAALEMTNARPDRFMKAIITL